MNVPILICQDCIILNYYYAKKAVELTKILNKNHHCVGKVKDLLMCKLCPNGEI